MSLPNDLVSRFAKIVKTRERSKKEATQYGTIKIDSDGNKYVQLDGSDILTPLRTGEKYRSTTASINDGNRVTVIIKNHELVVTGNLDDPSVQSTLVYDEETGLIKIASDAKSTADQAKKDAGNAQTIAGNAKTTAEGAVKAAGNAQTAAGNAQTTANEAKAAAGNAQSSANSAQNTANEAKTAAGTAQTTANEAKNAAQEAAKTASNFLYYDTTNGLQVGNKSSGSWSGLRSRMNGSSFDILSAAGDVLSSFGASMIELGKNAVNTVIKLCGGKGTISYNSEEEILDIEADDIRLKGTELSSVSAGYTDKSNVKRQSAVNVSPTEVQITSGINRTGVWDSSEIRVTPDGIDMTASEFSISGQMVDKDAGGLYLSVVEGSSGIWSYRKWSNGEVELWGTFNVSNLDCKTALGNMYRTGVFSSPSFPFTVYNAVTTASYESAGYGAMLWATTITSTSAPPSYYLIRPTSATIASGKIHFYVRGKWTNT